MIGDRSSHQRWQGRCHPEPYPELRNIPIDQLLFLNTVILKMHRVKTGFLNIAAIYQNEQNAITNAWLDPTIHW